MHRKKIIHLIQSLDNGGCENMLLRTLPLLSDFQHIIITLNRKGGLAAKFEACNISVINIDQRSPFDIFAYKCLLQNIKKNNPDLIVTYLFHADIIGRIFLQIFTDIKIIPFLRTTYNHKKYWVARLFEKLTKYFVKNYLANSESVQDFYVKEIGVTKEKITVIPNGIDSEFFDSISRDEKFRKELNINQDETAIICVANFHINKGHKYLLEAFENIYKENPKIKLLLAGDGDERENLLKQMKEYESKNNILFLGKRSDVPQLLKISDIFVLPTLFEGMSNAIMEAMASGLAVITTDIPENKQLIRNKENGLLIHARSHEGITDNLRTLIDRKSFRSALGDSAKKSICKNFNLKKVKSDWTVALSK